jgi:hypothetical protein
MSEPTKFPWYVWGAAVSSVRWLYYFPYATLAVFILGPAASLVALLFWPSWECVGLCFVGFLVALIVVSFVAKCWVGHKEIQAERAIKNAAEPMPLGFWWDGFVFPIEVVYQIRPPVCPTCRMVPLQMNQAGNMICTSCHAQFSPTKAISSSLELINEARAAFDRGRCKRDTR